MLDSDHDEIGSDGPFIDQAGRGARKGSPPVLDVISRIAGNLVLAGEKKDALEAAALAPAPPEPARPPQLIGPQFT
jgi:hypothetical protein